MKSLKSILSMAIIFAVCATFSANAQKEAHKKAVKAHAPANDISKEQAQKILKAYLEVKNALVKTDGDAASAAAAKLVASLDNSKGEEIEKIRLDAEHIAKTKDSSHQRDHFETLSNNVYNVVKATGANESTVYRQYCPMAMNNKGAYWLSSEKEVMNPYFGDKMLKCGSVKETIE